MKMSSIKSKRNCSETEEKLKLLDMSFSKGDDECSLIEHERQNQYS